MSGDKKRSEYVGAKDKSEYARGQNWVGLGQLEKTGERKSVVGQKWVGW